MNDKFKKIIGNYAVGLVFHEIPEENAYHLLMSAKNESSFYKLDNFTLSEEYEHLSFSSIKKVVNEKVNELEYFLEELGLDINSENISFHFNMYKKFLENSIKNPFINLSFEQLSDGTFKSFLYQTDKIKNDIVSPIINSNQLETVVLQITKEINKINNPSLVTGMHNIYFEKLGIVLDDDIHEDAIYKINDSITMYFNESGTIDIDNVEYNWEIGKNYIDIETSLIETLIEEKKENRDTKKIRLEWSHDKSWTFEDLIVPINYSNHQIQDSINLALLSGEDEVNKFIEISKSKGFEVSIFRENIEVFDFNSINRDELTEEDLVKLELVGKDYNEEEIKAIYEIASSLLSSDGNYTIAEATNEAIIEFAEQSKEAANNLRTLIAAENQTQELK